MDADDKGFTRYPIPGADAQNPYCTCILVRKSRFLAQCCHCPSVAYARSFVAEIRNLRRDATHNCWAFVAGPPASTACIGSSDDGEPHGTAGKPILQVLLHCGIGQICMVVSRWFGGIKLGTGGLARAYQQCALENISTLPRMESIVWSRWKITAQYSHADPICRSIPAIQAKIENAEYGEKVEFIILIPVDKEAELKKIIGQISNGCAYIDKIN